MASTFGERVREAREDAHMTQAELARAIGVRSQQAIGYLESSKSAAQASKYTSEIARVTGVNPHWLARGEGPKSPDPGIKATAGVYGTAGQKAPLPRSEAEKLLAIVVAFLNTDARGRKVIAEAAMGLAIADESTTRRQSRARGRRR
jgi:transcriptional regulator with XRE-family HTH domain